MLVLWKLHYRQQNYTEYFWFHRNKNFNSLLSDRYHLESTNFSTPEVEAVIWKLKSLIKECFLLILLQSSKLWIFHTLPSVKRNTNDSIHNKNFWRIYFIICQYFKLFFLVLLGRCTSGSMQEPQFYLFWNCFLSLHKH